ncbi:MAG: DUF928 domain-containing protein [Leptolyngbyaceae cyanobacterium bins.349]|nr:DUF928 domain-containing protein [Leptolyngbyaceae cyanobacterium bins.349]
MYRLKGVQVLSAVFVCTAIALPDLSQWAAAKSGPTSEPLQLAQRRRLSFRVGVRPSRFRVGGFSRAATCGDRDTMIALVPPPQAQEAANRRTGEEPVDKTASDRPTFFFYAPYTSPKAAQFTLQDEKGTQQLYNIKFQLTGKPGIVGISLPKSGPALQVGQKYVWQVAVACTPDDISNTVVISSWIERVASSASQIGTLAEQGIWQDTVSLLALSRFQKPDDRQVAADWSSLMEDAGLAQFKQTAIVQLVRNSN